MLTIIIKYNASNVKFNKLKKYSIPEPIMEEMALLNLV